MDNTYILVELFFKGGPIMFVLLFLSVIYLTIIFTKLIQFFGSNLKRLNIFDPIYEYIKKKEFKKSKEELNKISHPIAKIILSALENKSTSIEDKENEITRIGEEEIRKLWYDSHVHSRHSLDLLEKIVGNHRIVYGTNFAGWDQPETYESNASSDQWRLNTIELFGLN